MSVLETVVDALESALGGALVSVTVYGTHATEATAEGPVRLCIELDPCDAATLRCCGSVLRGSWPVRIQPYFVSRGELARLSDVFPLRICAMLAQHRTLRGEDPLASIRIDREHLRLGVEQGLRNHLVRLRTQVAQHDADSPASRAALLAVSEGVDDAASVVGALGALSPEGSMPEPLAERLGRLRDGVPADDSLLDDVLTWLGRAVEEVDRLGDG